MDETHNLDSLTDSWSVASDLKHRLKPADPWERRATESSHVASMPSSSAISPYAHPENLARNAEVPLRSDEELGREKGKGKAVVKDLGGVVGPLSVAVWADVMDTSKGRDKVLKCAQYSLRTYLYLLSIISRVRPLSRWFMANRKRSSQAVSSLSLTRKCLLLLNPLHPLTHILSPAPTSASALIQHLIDLASAISDDIYCLSRLGLVSRRRGKAADRWANRFWLLNTLIALYKLHLQTIPRLVTTIKRAEISADITTSRDSETAAQARAKLGEATWTNRKLLADLIFVSYDVFHLTWFEEPVKCVTGMAAALISTSKLYDQHWRAGLGKG